MISQESLEWLLKLPVVGKAIRLVGGSFKDGSVVTIRRGRLAGMKWQRFHRHVNGYWAGIYEKRLQDLLVMELHQGGVFYDIGANAGFFSLLAARVVGAEGKVYSFEPLDANAADIERQMTLNRVQHYEVHRVALSSKHGKMRMLLGVNSSMGRIVPADERNSNEAIVSVDVTTLDDFVETHEVPELIKIDVEGEEARVLEGANRLLNSAHPPELIIELHGESVGRLVMEKLRSCGYRLMDLERKELDSLTALPSHLFATK